MPNRMAFALVLAMLLPAFSTAAFATSAQSFQSRISVTMTQSVEGSGSTRTVSHVVTVTDLRGGLTQGTPSGEQIKVHFTSFLCDTPRTGIVVPPPRQFLGSWLLGSGIRNRIDSLPFGKRHLGTSFACYVKLSL